MAKVGEVPGDGVCEKYFCLIDGLDKYPLWGNHARRSDEKSGYDENIAPRQRTH